MPKDPEYDRDGEDHDFDDSTYSTASGEISIVGTLREEPGGSRRAFACQEPRNPHEGRNVISPEDPMKSDNEEGEDS